MAAGEFGVLDCDQCEEQKDLKITNQCEGGPDRWMILRGNPMQFEIDRCPLSYLDKSIERAFELYNDREQGHYPIGGGALEQIQTGWAAFELIEKYLRIMGRK